MRIATPDDISTVKDMAMKFLAVSGYAEFGDEQTVENLITDLVSSPVTDKIILINPEVGFIAGVATPFLLGRCILVSEIAWWVEEDKRGTGEGLKLLEAFEYWAKNVAEAKLISMTSLDKTVEKYYKKNGYKLYERAYMKIF